MRPRVAIVDYGMGNLFSVKHALEHVGLDAVVTSAKDDILKADAVVLPGVGAFGDAMGSLHGLDLVGPLREIVASHRILVGICLGMQLMMTESYEFGTHRGLDLIPGAVVRLNPYPETPGRLKVPHVGWSRIFSREAPHLGSNARTGGGGLWESSPLEGLADGKYVYFVHSFYPQPQDPDVALSFSRYGDIEFCSSLWRDNVFACQFHPERSGPQGLRIYRNLASLISQAITRETPAR